VGGPGINYVKRKKGKVQIMTQNIVKNRTIQRMALKGTIAIFAVKEYWH
jgi:hypothetical protein